MEVIIYVCAVFLLIIGISEIIHSAALYLTRPKRMPRRCLLVKLDELYAEEQVLSVLCEFRWSGSKYADKAVFLTDNLAEDKINELKKEYSSSYAEFKNGVLYGREEQGNL